MIFHTLLFVLTQINYILFGNRPNICWNDTIIPFAGRDIAVDYGCFGGKLDKIFHAFFAVVW